MSTRWRKWRTRSRLAGLLGADEKPLLIERLVLGGWWVITPAALYMIPLHGAPTRLPYDQIQSTRSVSGKVSAMVFVTTTAGDVVVADLRPNSEVAKRLQELAPPTEPSS